MKRSDDDFFEKISLKDPKTIKQYKIRTNSFFTYLKEKNIGFESLYDMEIEQVLDILQRYVNWFAKEHNPVSVQNFATSIRKYIHYRGIPVSKEDFSESIELPEIGEPEYYPLQLHEIKTILSNLKYKEQAWVICQLSGGFRIGELVQLRKKHFITDKSRIIVRIPKEIAKFKKARTAIISKEAGLKITPILKKLDDNDLVFGTNENYLSSEGGKQSILRNCLEKTGLTMKYDTGRYKINTHAFRAYFITKVSRHDPNLAKKLAGQKGYVLQYDRLTDEELLESYLKFEPDLLIYSDTRKEIQTNQKLAELEQKVESQDKIINELLNERIKTMIANGEMKK